MRRIGFTDAELTGNGRDHGKDIVSERAIAQVKRETAKTSEPQIRDLLGTAKREGKIPVFYSLAGYSDAAIAWAGRAVALFQYSQSGEVTPINSRAHSLASADDANRPGTPSLQGTTAPHSSSAVTGGFAKFILIAVFAVPLLIGLAVWSEQQGTAFEDDVSDVRGEIPISRAEYEEAGKTWPFKFDEGTLQCRGEEQVVTAVFDGVVYGIEGVEDYQLEDLGWYRSWDILLADEGGFPGAKASLEDVLHEGRSACATAPN